MSPECVPFPTVKIVLVILLALLFNPLTGFLLGTAVENVKMDGDSMAPSLQNGEFGVVNEFDRSPSRGDIVVFKDPGFSAVWLVKRVIGLPGETVEIINGTVLIDGEALDEPWIESTWHYTGGAVRMETNQYFLMGDNRDNSKDSRSVGPISEDLIVGTWAFTYWPASHNPLGTATVLGIVAVLALIGIGAWLATGILAHRRRRSLWWTLTAVPLAWAGFALVFFAAGPRTIAAAR
jgi:signal peptidase I